MKAHGVVVGRIPTDIDVERLVQEIGVPGPEDLILYTKVEEILHTSRDKSRYDSVVAAWRRRLIREHNVYLEAVPNTGYRPRDDHNKIEYGYGKHRRGVKQLRESARVAVKTPLAGLDELHAQMREYLITSQARADQAVAIVAREIRFSVSPVKSLTA